jgi:hypothetical protein
VTIEQKGGGRWQRLQPRERALIIIVGIIALLAIAYLLFLSGGEDTPEVFPTFTPRSTPRVTASPTPETTAPPETFEVFEGKDPFRPLVTDSTAGGGGGPAPSPGSSPGSSGGTDGSQQVTLVDISGSGANRTATVEVNSTEYQVKEGETFAESYRVKDLTASCGTFVFGDEQFTLCVGQEVLK